MCVVLEMLLCCAAWVVHGTTNTMNRPLLTTTTTRSLSAAARRGFFDNLCTSSITMDASSVAESAFFTITTAFVLSRALTIFSAKLADALNAGVKLSDEKWENLLKTGKLSRQAYNVLRHSSTERPFSSELNDEKRTGVYVCAACGTDLFSSANKFDSGSGWPSFFDALQTAEVTENNVIDKVVNMRQEIHCSTCGGHLGHVFGDGVRWRVPTG